MKIEGRNAILEYLRTRQPARRLIIEKDINVDEKIAEIKKLAQSGGVEFEVVSKKLLDKISDTGVHQGVILKADYSYQSFSDVLKIVEKRNRPPFKFIYIREAQLEGNVGAVGRTAEAAGFAALFIPPQLDITPQAWRASTGAFANLPVVQESLFNVLKAFHDLAVKIIAVETSGEVSPFEADLTGDVLFIVGGEDRSLSAEVLQKCDLVVKIPQFGKINSLNLSVAAAVVMYEAVRQERFGGTN